MFKSTLNSISSLNQTTLNQATRILLTSKQGVISDQISKQSVRYARNIKPWKNGPIEFWKKNIYNYEYRKARCKKVLKINLPDFNKTTKSEKNLKMSVDEMRSSLKEKGIVPQRNWIEKPIYIGDSGSLMEKYVPPEGDGKASIISKKGAVQKVDAVDERRKQFLALRKIRKYIDAFDPQEWALNEGLKIYINAHEALAKYDEAALLTLVTDYCLPKMLFNCELKTIKWNYVKTIDLPRVVNISSQIQDGIGFAQVTVRFHSQQILAIYDKFGRLVGGSEAILKDVLDYIVFENKISSVHGIWRIHDKIQPEWIAPNELSRETIIKSFEQRSEE